MHHRFRTNLQIILIKREDNYKPEIIMSVHVLVESEEKNDDCMEVENLSLIHI